MQSFKAYFCLVVNPKNHALRTRFAVQELQCQRTWTVALHPQWLLLEVEGQLQIRCLA